MGTTSLKTIPNQNNYLNGYNIEEVSDVETFMSLKDSWDNLLSQSGDDNIFLTWEWLFHWWKYYGDGKKLRILLIKDKNELIGIAPLMQMESGYGFWKVKVLENICSWECDYSGIIIRKDCLQAVAPLIHYVKHIVEEENVIFRLSQIPEYSTFLEKFREISPLISTTCEISEIPLDICYYISSKGTFEDYLSSLSPKTRRRVRYRINVLEKNHTYKYSQIQTRDEINPTLETLFKLYKKRWLNTNVTNKFDSDSVKQFYRDVSDLFFTRNWLDLSVLDIDGTIVSVFFCFNYNNACHAMTIGWDPDYSQYSLMNVHITETAKTAFDSGLSKYDFLKGDLPYKLHWTSDKTQNYQILWIKKGLSGWYQKKLLKLHWRLDYIRNHSLGYILKFIWYQKILRKNDVLFD